MKKSLMLAVVMFLTAATAALAENGVSETKQAVKRDAREAKEGIKSGAKEFWHSVRAGAVKVKRQVAVAQCNDGEYSYTHHTTCNHHGGVRQQLR